jgi:hypothetical protein
MGVIIKFLVNGGVFYPEVGAKIDHARASGQERFGKFGSEAVRQRKKNKTSVARDLFWVRIGKFERGRRLLMREARENVRERFAGQLSRRCRHKIDMWMREQQPHKFLAGVTGSAYHRDLRSRHNAQCVFRLARIATKSC